MAFAWSEGYRVQLASRNISFNKPRGCSSAGRAPDLHSGGRRFDPDQLHQLQKAGLGP